MPRLETSLYSVSLLNDDITPMDFVVHVLEVFFDMDHDTAKQRMLLVHHQGTAVAILTNSRRKRLVVAFARKHKHPLQCIFEKALRVPEA
jgi:ATP-dependent Clp protease adaptor protein ClpS